MRYGASFLWAALQMAFLWLFFGSFLPPRQPREESRWLLLFLWLAGAVYGFWPLPGIYGYLMYLLAGVLLLLCVFCEAGGRGLGLLAFAFLISLCCDHMIPQPEGWLLYPAVTAGKLLPLGLVWLLRRFRRPPASAAGQDSEALLLRQHMEMQQESMQALEQSYRLQRKNTHEFEHHLQVLRELMGRGETEAAEEYLDRLKKNRAIHAMGVSTRHPVIDAILNQKYQTARENGIRMQLQVNDLSVVRLGSDSLVVILANLLDNAIEACRRLDGCREIYCSILWEEGLYISIRNTSEEVAVVDGKIPTSKQDSLSHGFGLMSVSLTLDQLGAEYTFGYQEGWFHFAAEIE